MNRLRAALALVASLALALATLPAAAAAPGGPDRGSVSFRGTTATASWFIEGEPGVGEPGAVFAMVAQDAVQIMRGLGGRPLVEAQPSFVAMSMLFPGENPGDDPYWAEVWATPETPMGEVADDLTSASMEFECMAVIVGWDPVTEEEVVIGEMPVSVSAYWASTSDVMRNRYHSNYRDDSSWGVDFGRSTYRLADAELTIVGPDGVLFDGPLAEGEITKTTGTSVFHSWTVPEE